MPLKILIVENEFKNVDLLISNLIQHDYVVDHIKYETEALTTILEGEYDLVLLDIMFSSQHGMIILEKVRQSGNNIPFILFVAKDNFQDMLRGFELGADDYLTKPFFMDELILLININILRKNNLITDEVMKGGLKINKLSNRVEWIGISVKFSQREFRLIEYLMRSPNYVFSRKQILENVWEIFDNHKTNVVDVYVERIRKRFNLKNNNNLPFPIETVRGIGYRFIMERESFN